MNSHRSFEPSPNPPASNARGGSTTRLVFDSTPPSGRAASAARPIASRSESRDPASAPRSLDRTASPFAEPAPVAATVENQERTITFRVPVTVVELDADRKPAREFQGRTVEICQAHLVLLTRRMVYDGTCLLLVLPLLDDKPSVLGGIVRECRYDAAGEYRVILEFSSHVRSRFVEQWMEHRGCVWWKRPE